MKNLVFVSICFFLFVANVYTSQLTYFLNVDVEKNPTSLAITPDGALLYVVNFGDNTVSVINANNLQVVTTISGFDQPYSVSINPSGTKAYVTNSRYAGANSVTVIDIATQVISAVITGFNAPRAMVITSDGNFGYVANYGNSVGVAGTTVNYVDLTSNTISGSAIIVGNYPSALAITPDNAYVYVANYNTGSFNNDTVSVIRTSDHVVIATIPDFFGPRAIAIHPDGKYVYVTNYGNNSSSAVGTTVAVIDSNAMSPTFNTIVSNIVVGTQPSGISISPDGSYAYVTLYNNGAQQGYIKIIQLSNNEVILPIIPVSSGPYQIICSPYQKYLYIVDYLDNLLQQVATEFFTLVINGCKTKNIFLTQKDLINRLTWQLTGQNLPDQIGIYRDVLLTDRVAIVPSNTKIFYDHNRRPSIDYTYYIVGILRSGPISSPVEVKVTKNC
ncbi:YncE family protein [Candidatus Dependentiae bacterium]|nr:YncE family protein [Candidatus Dependentiae bacterium]